MRHSFRQVHLDFHTSPDIPDVGAEWDADAFVATLQGAKVESINVFAKCHHGMNYYPTNVGVRHPHLGIDLLGAQIQACHSVGIQAPIYFSVCWDVSAAERHAEWCQIDLDGRRCGAKPSEPGWPFLCVNTGYADEIAAQVEELLDLYDVDGFWFDILFYAQGACVCPSCQRRMRARGLDSRNPSDLLTNRQEVAREFMDRMSRLIWDRKPEAGVFFNGRMGFPYESEHRFFSQTDIESLPTGGWGYGYYPFWARFATNLSLPHVGMTGRFHNSWADWGGLKHPDALAFECGGILATGGRVNVGDQLHPRGRLDPAVYEVIGEAFSEVERIEPWMEGVALAADVALLCCPDPRDHDGTAHNRPSFLGAAKLLQEVHAQFRVVTPGTFDPTAYRVVVVPDETSVLPTSVVQQLRTFVEGGGKLVTSGTALLEVDRGDFALADLTGIRHAGTSPYDVAYFSIAPDDWRAAGLRPGFRYYLGAYPTERLRTSKPADVLAQAWEPYFSRTGEHFCSHGLTPPKGAAADHPAIVATEHEVRFFGPLFTAYWEKGAIAVREIVRRCLARLLWDPLVATNAPATAEVTCLQGEAHWLTPIVNFSATRPGGGYQPILESPVPLRDYLSVRLPFAPRRALLAVAGEPLEILRIERHGIGQDIHRECLRHRGVGAMSDFLWGIDLGGTKIEGVVLPGNGQPEPLCRVRIDTEAHRGYPHIVERIGELVGLMVQRIGSRPERIGIGTPGTVDPPTGLMKNCNTTCLNGQPLPADVERALGVPITIANDANCFALAEATHGVAVGCDTVFGVILGTGVGGGMVVHGRVLAGAQGIAGEWGHNTLLPDGPDCYCGRRGCVETVISGPATERFYASLSGQSKKLADIYAAHLGGSDPHATATIERLCAMFGRAIAVIVNTFDPHAVVLGGGVGNVPELLTLGVEACRAHTFNNTLDARFLAPSLGDSAGVFGAAMLVA